MNYSDEATPLILSEEVFLKRFMEHASASLAHAYEVTHPLRASHSGKLTTSLSEDVFSLLETQRKVLEEYIESDRRGITTGERQSIILQGLLYVLRELKQVQRKSRPLFFTSIEDACAAANDFMRMAELLERFLHQLSRKYVALMNHIVPIWHLGKDLLERADDDGSTTIADLGQALISQFSQDAVYAAERIQVFFMRSIHQTSIPADFFSDAWEERWTHNEVAFALIRIVAQGLDNARKYLLHELLYRKTQVITAKAVTCFYLRCLVEKADVVSRRRRRREVDRSPFTSQCRALIRIAGDVSVITTFFKARAEGDLVLSRILADELRTLEIIYECLSSTDEESLEGFIVVIHKKTGGDPLVTRYFFGDLWLLMANQMGRKLVQDTVANMLPELQKVTTNMRDSSASEKDPMSHVQLDEMLKALYEDRLAHGIMPACWACLPKVETDDGDVVVAKRIRALTRSIAEMKWGQDKRYVDAKVP